MHHAHTYSTVCTCRTIDLDTEQLHCHPVHRSNARHWFGAELDTATMHAAVGSSPPFCGSARLDACSHATRGCHVPDRQNAVCSQACGPRQSTRVPALMWRHGLAARMPTRKRPQLQRAAQAEHSDETEPQLEAGSVMLTADQRTLPFKLILALAAGGIAETSYLTLVSRQTKYLLKEA